MGSDLRLLAHGGICDSAQREPQAHASREVRRRRGDGGRILVVEESVQERGVRRIDSHLERLQPSGIDPAVVVREGLGELGAMIPIVTFSQVRIK